MVTSYAQNFEDVMLWRALGSVPNGRYLDIGAQHPVMDSVSKAFYLNGWRGWHVEPTLLYAELLKADRPDEQVLAAVVGTGKGERKFYEFPDTGLSTLDEDIARVHIERGRACKETLVSVVSLESILDDMVGEGEDIHWMKIDVEGAEKDVLSSWGKSPVRPWVLVVESTLPMSQVEAHQQWEKLLIHRRYEFAYFDGLNRFYVHESQRHLLSHFSSPPNVFDGFTFPADGEQVFTRDVRASLSTERARADEKSEEARKLSNLLEHAESNAQLSNLAVRLDHERALAWSEKEEVRNEALSRLQALRSEFLDVLAHRLEQERSLAANEKESLREGVWSRLESLRAEFTEKLETRLGQEWKSASGERVRDREETASQLESLRAEFTEKLEIRLGQEWKSASGERVRDREETVSRLESLRADFASELSVRMSAGMSSMESRVQEQHSEIIEQLEAVLRQQTSLVEQHRALAWGEKELVREEVVQLRALVDQQAKDAESQQNALQRELAELRARNPLRSAARITKRVWVGLEVRTKTKFKPWFVRVARQGMKMKLVKRLLKPLLVRSPRVMGRLSGLLQQEGLLAMPASPSAEGANRDGAAISGRARVLASRIGVEAGPSRRQEGI